MGFENGVDFSATQTSGGIRITWMSSEPQPTVAEVAAQAKPWAAAVKTEEIYREQEIRSTNIVLTPGYTLGLELPRAIIDIMEELYGALLKPTARNAITSTSTPGWYYIKALRDNRNTLLNGLSVWVADPLKTADDILAFNVIGWSGWSVAR